MEIIGHVRSVKELIEILKKLSLAAYLDIYSTIDTRHFVEVSFNAETNTAVIR